MCGIVGYVGHRECADVLMDGLTRLEYRGYDSAGIAVFENQSIRVAKSKGRLSELRKKLQAEGKPTGTAGIGHTRWATHGEPSDRNSHPHGGESVTLVHNGIIENYKRLKDFLLSEGRVFESDTDTEVVAQLLDHYYRRNHGNPMEAIVETMRELEGSFALGIIFADFPRRRLTALLQETPREIEKILENQEQAQYIASSLIAADSLLYVGRGLDHALSMEGSLKLKEISYIHSEAYAAGELKHGTISLITENMPVIAVATQKRLLEKTISNIKEVRARGAKVVLICGENEKIEQDAADCRFTIPEIDDLLMPIPAVVPLQLIAYYTAVYRGTDVDKPRNLAKSVTVE